METRMIGKYIRQKFGSYPTYEEWKQKKKRKSKARTKSSYPTYEEWKPLHLLYMYLSSLGSYPTYEEWKLACVYFALCFFLVLILPMRNGNIREQKKVTKEEKVLILPMRNGNMIRLLVKL